MSSGASPRSSPPARTDAARSERQVALLWGAIALAALALLPLAPRVAPLLPACPLRSALGIPCAACGSGRALVALARLDARAAVIANPLAALAAATFLLGGVTAGVAALLDRLPAEPRTLPTSLRWAVLVALVANWCYLWWVGR